MISDPTKKGRIQDMLFQPQIIWDIGRDDDEINTIILLTEFRSRWLMDINEVLTQKLIVQKLCIAFSVSFLS